MIQQTQDYGAIIDKLAEKLSVPAANLWRILVQQGRIDAVAATVWTLIAAAILVWAATSGWKRIQTWIDDDDNRYSDRVMVWIPFGVAVVGALAIFASNLPTAVSGWLNPEYLALRYILEAAK